MGKRVTGVTVERKLFTVLAPGVVSAASCLVDFEDCCVGSGAGSDCCTGEDPPQSSVPIAFDGPLLSTCVNATASGVLTRIGDVGLVFELLTPLAVEDGGTISAVLYCAGSEWRLNGLIQIADLGIPVYYDISLAPDPVLGLVGTIDIPGCDDPVTVAADVPCSGITTDCCPDNPTPSILNAVISGAGGGLDGIYQLLYLGGVWDYSTAADFGGCAGGGMRNILELLCAGSVWSFGVNAPMPALYTPDSVSCSPFELVYINVDLSGCGGSATATVTISPP